MSKQLAYTICYSIASVLIGAAAVWLGSSLTRIELLRLGLFYHATEAIGMAVGGYVIARTVKGYPPLRGVSLFGGAIVLLGFGTQLARWAFGDSSTMPYDVPVLDLFTLVGGGILMWISFSPDANARTNTPLRR